MLRVPTGNRLGSFAASIGELSTRGCVPRRSVRLYVTSLISRFVTSLWVLWVSLPSVAPLRFSTLAPMHGLVPLPLSVCGQAFFRGGASFADSLS